MHHPDLQSSPTPAHAPANNARADVRVVLTIALAHAAVQAALVWGVHQSGNPWRSIYRDPNAIAGQPFFFGWWSTVGGALFCAAGALGVFTHAALPNHRRRSARFLLHGGLLSLVLGADDLLMFHDGLLEAVGVPELATFALYAVATTAWLWSARSTILRAGRRTALFLAFALAALACSAAVDVLGGPLVIEDASKQTGILFWILFFWRAGRHMIDRAQSHATIGLDPPLSASPWRPAASHTPPPVDPRESPARRRRREPPKAA